MDFQPTYTRLEAEEALHIKSHSSFRHLQRKYPKLFVIAHKITDSSNPALYDKAAIDKFVEVRNNFGKVS